MIIHNIGFDTMGSFDHISTATHMGIHAIFHPMPADLAEVNTGARIRATTAGRMPLKMDVSVGLK